MNAMAARVFLALISIALVLGVAEAAFRLRASEGDALRGLHRSRADAPWLYELEPGARTRLGVSSDVIYEVNAAGYRGPLVPLEKPADAIRILVLGDSLAFGYGVAEPKTFVRRLEVGAPGPPRLEAINFGVGGYNPYNEAALFLGRGAAYSPDIVLVQFCINDLNDPTAHFDAQTRLELGAIPDEAFPDPRERPPAAAPPSCWRDPCSCSRVCSAITAVVDRWRGTQAPLDLAALAPRQLPVGPSRRWLGDRYEEIARAARAIGAQFAVVVFPYRDQVESDAPSTVQAQLAELGRERGFVVIDLLPGFRAAQSRLAEDSDPLFLDLWHPSDEGHRVAADAIRGKLESLGWIPGSDAPSR